MAATHADVLVVVHDDARDPARYTDVTYTPHREGVTVWVGGGRVEHRGGRVVAEQNREEAA